jgi:hypothetical protein
MLRHTLCAKPWRAVRWMLIVSVLTAQLPVRLWAQAAASYTIAEYNAYMAAANQSDPTRQIAALDSFVSSYPNSSLLRYIYVNYYQAYNKQHAYVQTIAYVDKLVALGNNLDAPTRFAALYNRAAAYASLNSNDPELAKSAQDAALEGLKTLHELNKPAGTDDATFASQKVQIEDYFNKIAAVAAARMHAPVSQAAANAQSSAASDGQDAQQNAPAGDAGPSLEATMKFIEDKVNGIDKVEYAFVQKNPVTGEVMNSATMTHRVHITLNPSTCGLHWEHVWLLGDGSGDPKTIPTQPVTVSFKDAQRMEVLTVEEADNRSFAASAKETIAQPTPYELKLYLSSTKKPLQFYFFDQDLANRVAKAMVHATELCGGGNSDPF